MNIGKKMRYTAPMVDIMFFILAITGITMIVRMDKFAVAREKLAKTLGPAMPAAGGDWKMAAILIAVTLAITAIVIFGAKFDRRCAEDYIFQIMANASFAVVPSTLFIYFIWDFRLLSDSLPPIEPSSLAGAMLLSWSVAYLWYRIKGLGQ